MDSFKAFELLWFLAVLIISSSQAYFIPGKESEYSPNALAVTSNYLKHLNLISKHKDIAETPQYSSKSLPTFNNYQEQRKNLTRFKRWGWNPINAITQTFENVKNDVENTFVSVQKVGQDVVEAAKTNGAIAFDFVDNTLNDAVVVVEKAGGAAIDTIENTYKSLGFNDKSVINGIESFVPGSINVINVNSERLVAVISKNVIEPIRSQAEIIINDEETMKLINHAALEGSCAVVGKLTNVQGAIVTGVACELIRQIQDEGFDSVADKIKNGDIKFISKLVLKGACGGVTATVGLAGTVAAEEGCTITEIVIDNDEVLKDQNKLALKLGLVGACAGLGSLGGAPGAAITAVGCSIANDLNEQGEK